MEKIMTGIVQWHVLGRYAVLSADKLYYCRQKMAQSNSSHKLSVVLGDEVEFRYIEQDKLGLITAVKPRISLFSKKNSSGTIQNIAANADTMAIVIAIKQPSYSIGFITRFLFSAIFSSCKVLIIINKIDLVGDDEILKLKKFCKDINILEHSINNGTLTGEIIKFFKNKKVILVGQSGVGKSSLINKIIPGANVKTAELIKKISKGRHTTTLAKNYNAPDFSIIDTPGVQHINPIVGDLSLLAKNFNPFASYVYRCQYSNCLHLNEPGCGLKAIIGDSEELNLWYSEYVKAITDQKLKFN